jgi:hypothetical protein
MPRPPRKQSGPPTAAIQSDADFSWALLLALMGWPKNVREQCHTLATYAADLLGYLQQSAPHVARVGPDHAWNEFARLYDIPVQHLPFMRATRAHFEHTTLEPVTAARAIVDQMWNPAGGFKSVADAPGTETVLAQFARASSQATPAGTLLLFVAVFDAAHPDIAPSLAKAMRSFLATGYSLPGFVAVGEKSLKRWWKEWRGVAPVWAALNLQCNLTPMPLEAAVWETLLDPMRRRQTLGWAKWFREFGTTFRPSGADGPLIPLDEAVELRFDVPQEVPPLAAYPFPAAWLAAARDRRGGS